MPGRARRAVWSRPANGSPRTGAGARKSCQPSCRSSRPTNDAHPVHDPDPRPVGSRERLDTVEDLPRLRRIGGPRPSIGAGMARLDDHGIEADLAHLTVPIGRDRHESLEPGVGEADQRSTRHFVAARAAELEEQAAQAVEDGLALVDLDAAGYVRAISYDGIGPGIDGGVKQRRLEAGGARRIVVICRERQCRLPSGRWRPARPAGCPARPTRPAAATSPGARRGEYAVDRTARTATDGPRGHAAR